MAKILVITDDPNATTGNGKVCKNLCLEFEKLGHTITSIVAWNCFGGTNKYPWKLRVIDPEKQMHNDTGIKVQNEIRMEEPDIIFCHGDIWNFPYMPNIKTTAKKIGYITVDFEPSNKGYIPLFASFDALVSPSMYGKRATDKAAGFSMSYVPEGVDTDIFKAPSDEERRKMRNNLKTNAAKAMLNIPDFLITMLSRPIQRKNLPAGIRAIGRLASEFNDIGHICLYDTVNSGTRNGHEHNMARLHNRYLPPDMPKFAVSGVGAMSQNVTDEVIASYLGASDVLIMPTMAEGFGLPVLEALACGCVPIVTNCTSMPDIVDSSRGFLVDVGAIVTDVSLDTKNMEQSLISDEHLYKTLKYAYEHRGKLESMRKEGIKFAKKMTWKRCAESIDKIMKAAIDGSYASITMEEV